MGLMKLFRRAAPQLEQRALPATFTAQIAADRHAWIAGTSPAAELSATVQACVSLWEAGLTMADVTGTDLLRPGVLALTARALALRGEVAFLIAEDGLRPACAWELRTRAGVPQAYRLTLAEAEGQRTVTALAAEVLHLRIGADPLSPWAGRSPLRRAPVSAQLLVEVETALRDVFRDAPLGSQIIPLPESSAEDMAAMRAGFRGRRGASLVIEGAAQATAAGMNPQIGQRPEGLSPDLSRSMTGETLEAARHAVALTFGVLPGMLNPATTGPMVREGQRHLAQWVLQPIAILLAEEASAKLGAPVTIDVVRPAQAFDAGGRARAFAAMVKALAEAKAAGLEPQAVEDALSFIDWAEE